MGLSTQFSYGFSYLVTLLTSAFISLNIFKYFYFIQFPIITIYIYIYSLFKSSDFLSADSLIVACFLSDLWFFIMGFCSLELYLWDLFES